MKHMKKTIAGALTVIGALVLTSCSDSDVVSRNLSKDADNFKIQRRIVFLNGITDTYLLSVEGRCNITDEEHQLEVVCDLGGGEYKKHFLGLSDNVTYFAEQLEGKDVSKDHYAVIFKPKTIIPDVEVR